MKKTILGVLILFAAVLLTPVKTFAVGGFSVSPEEINLHPGDTTSFSITASNSAGKIDVLSNDTSVATINTDSVFLDLDSTEIIVTATGIGSTTISVTATANFATYDEEILEGQSYQISVNVTEEPQQNDNPQDPETTPDQENQIEHNDQNTTPSTTANTPDTGSNSQSSSGATQIIISSVVGVSVATALFVAFYLRKRAKEHQ